MSLYVYTTEQSNKWDEIVRSFKSHDVYYLSGYVKAFQVHGDGQPLLFYYEGKDIRGINVVMQRDIAEDTYFGDKISRGTFFDFITPYGYGGWLIEGEGNKEPLFEEYEQWCRTHNVVSEFVRYHPVLNNAEMSKPFYDVIALGKTIAMDLSSPDIIFQNLTSQNRNKFRKAQKSGINIYRGHYPEIYKIFKEIYNQTMDSDHAKAYYYFGDEFYESIINDLSDEAQIFWAELDGKIIAASIMIAANGYMNYHLSGSLREYQNLAPTNLLIYKAAIWGSLNGYKSLHLGGGVGSKEDSLYLFKSGFNRNDTKQFSIGKKIYLNDVYDDLVSMKNCDVAVNYFPQYRA
ncbi:MAG: peptidoglycan bridge formation glycyltransferase FemA/FemB family protein [Clostridia bacterium]|nr:peptidoglycan bridge formation glycyltransferase FemA/FemB family protein [Clostridia bacterium]